VIPRYLLTGRRKRTKGQNSEAKIRANLRGGSMIEHRNREAVNQETDTQDIKKLSQWKD